jgi:voltage-gated potassium channel
MRHALIEEMEDLEKELARANNLFLQNVEQARPTDTERALQSIDRLASEWDALNEHLQEVDEAILERHLHTRLSRLMGSSRNLYLWDGAIFISIIAVVIVTLTELFVPFTAEQINILSWVDTGISLFLLGDFFLRLLLSEDKGWYFRRYWIDFISSIPFYQFFRFAPLVPIARVARLVRLLRVGRALRVLLFAFRSLDKLFETFQLNLLKRALIIAAALLFFGALSISASEGAQERSLLDLGESLWWSFTTVVTGGFADLYNPESLSGRLITVGLVLLGLVVTSIFTASLTSVLVEDDSTRIKQTQRNLEKQIASMNQKVDLLSGETNQALLALETVAQELSNQRSREAIGLVLTEAMTRNFEGIQASVHLLTDDNQSLERVAHSGLEQVAPAQQIPLSEGLLGQVVTELLAQKDAAEIDLEPETELCLPVRGITMVCPLVAGRQVLGALQVVLPENLGRYYLYNRAPMTLAHHAAMAFYAASLNQRQP